MVRIGRGGAESKTHASTAIITPQSITNIMLVAHEALCTDVELRCLDKDIVGYTN